MNNGKNLIGSRFGRLREKLWLCKCDCGNEKITPTSYLTSGDTSIGKIIL